MFNLKNAQKLLSFVLISISVSLLMASSLCYADCHLLPQETNQATEEQPELLVFLSFSMPKESLKLWLTQTAQAKGKCLLRGFLDNSLEKTNLKILALFDNKDMSSENIATLQIHPEAFSNFSIKAVPAVVVTKNKPCLSEPCDLPDYDVIYGDTSLEDALRTLIARGLAQGKELASLFLQQYRETHE